jgi:hypothetical protein
MHAIPIDNEWLKLIGQLEEERKSQVYNFILFQIFQQFKIDSNLKKTKKQERILEDLEIFPFPVSEELLDKNYIYDYIQIEGLR